MRGLRIRMNIVRAVLGLAVTFGGQAFAAPIISEVTTGTSGDYTLNFSVTNNPPERHQQHLFLWPVDG